MRDSYTDFVTCYECSEDIEVEFFIHWDEFGDEYYDTNITSCPKCGDENFMCYDSGDSPKAEMKAERKAMGIE